MSSRSRGAPSWVEPAARAGYAAKGAVYAVVGALAIRAALGGGGDAGGGKEALQFVGSGPFGQAILGLIAAGLAGYVVWRLVQAFLDPEKRDDDGAAGRIGRRGFFFASAAIYGVLAYYAVDLLIGSGGGGGGTQRRVADVMGNPWGRWLVGLIGAGTMIRGILQGVKAYTQSFRKKIKSFDFGPARQRWVIAAIRIGLTARCVVFLLIGGYLVWAAWTHDPSKARGTEGALATLADRPGLLAAVGAGLCCYGLYQWVKARYRLISV